MENNNQQNINTTPEQPQVNPMPTIPTKKLNNKIIAIIILVVVATGVSVFALTHKQEVSLIVKKPETKKCTKSICITAPLDGTIVAPGQTVKVVVSVASNFNKGVAVIGEDPLPFFAEPKMQAPYEFSVDVPNKISLGKYKLTAVGGQSVGQGEFSDSVSIDVEKNETVTNLEPSIHQIVFGGVGEDFPLDISATFSDGIKTDIEKSTQITFKSDNEKVATVTSYGSGTLSAGIVTAVGGGKANITVNYQNKNLIVPISVPLTSTAGDINGDGKVTVDDMNIILDVIGVSAGDDVDHIPDSKTATPIGSSDPRDVNKDGIINNKDVAMIKNLIGSADLVVNITPPQKTTAGMELTYNINITNNGSGVARDSDIVGSMLLSGSNVFTGSPQSRQEFEVDYVSSSISQGNSECMASWTAANNLGFSCFLGNLDKGKTASAKITVKIKSPGNLQTKVTARSPIVPDTNESNNTAIINNNIIKN